LVGYKGNKVYQNTAGKLPPGGKYKEYDIDPKVQGVHRTAERIVIDENTGRAWYTSDHYETFIEIK
jgi:ribonuclease T1